RVSSQMAAHSSSSSSSAITNPPSPSPSQSIDFLSICHRLKTTKRAGWLRKDVKDSESIADHMYRMGLMALIAPDFPGIDRDKCVKMAIVHDIAEAIVGDITPTDGIPKEEKSRREQEALDHMCRVLGGGSRAKEIAELWTEYEANSSPEAKFVKDFDKVEMILQALEYEDEQGKDLDEFFRSTAGFTIATKPVNEAVLRKLVFYMMPLLSGSRGPQERNSGAIRGCKRHTCGPQLAKN
ncbi:HD domain-containing protein 2-like, partial [Trifolium pratense]